MSIKITKSRTIFLEIKQSFVLSLPLVASNLIRAASGFIGTMMVAHLGKLTLDGMALGGSVFFTLVVFFFGMLNAVSVLVSQNFGAKNNAGISSSVSQGFIMAIVVSIPMYLIIWMSPLVFRFTHESTEIIRLATIYLRTISIAVLPFSFLIVMNQFLVGMSKTRLVLCISLLQVPFEILLTYLFVYGGFGVPEYGIAGVGYAFAIVFSVAAICIGLFICKSKQYGQFRIFFNFGKIQYRYLSSLVRIGWPIGCIAVIEVALFAVITFFMGEIGDDQLAAYQIFSQYIGISVMIIFAISQVTTIRVGQAVGRQDKKSIKRIAYVNMLLGATCMTIMWGIFIVFYRKVIGVDINVYDPKNAVMVHYAIIFFVFGGIAQVIDVFRFVTIGVLRGLKDTRVPMGLSFVSFWLIAFPLSYCFAFVLDLGAVGLLYGILAGIISGLIFQLRRMHKVLNTIDLEECYMRL